MPTIRVVLYREADGTIPVLNWLESLPERAQDKCAVRIERLGCVGHELRRPEAGYLRDGIHELRAKLMGINLRVLYFFHGRGAAVLVHGLSKQRARVQDADIRLAIDRRSRFLEHPAKHWHEEAN